MGWGVWFAFRSLGRSLTGAPEPIYLGAHQPSGPGAPEPISHQAPEPRSPSTSEPIYLGAHQPSSPTASGPPDISASSDLTCSMLIRSRRTASRSSS
jgi:hypothetical protein